MIWVSTRCNQRVHYWYAVSARASHANVPVQRGVTEIIGRPWIRPRSQETLHLPSITAIRSVLKLVHTA
jgi:hypothetical protein